MHRSKSSRSVGKRSEGGSLGSRGGRTPVSRARKLADVQFDDGEGSQGSSAAGDVGATPPTKRRARADSFDSAASSDDDKKKKGADLDFMYMPNYDGLRNIPTAPTDKKAPAPRLAKRRLDREKWGDADAIDDILKYGAEQKVQEIEEPAPGILFEEAAKQAEEFELAQEQKVMEGDAKSTNPLKLVVFGGKQYEIPQSSTTEEHFGAASPMKAKARQWRLKFDKSPVVLTSRTQSLVRAVGLKDEHLRKLRAQFAVVDFTGMGNVTYSEFFEFIDEPRSPFTDLIYDRIVEKAGSKTLDFDAFVCVVTVYSMYSKFEIQEVLFEIFDQDSSGAIDEDEFMDLCRMVNNGNPTFPGNYNKAMGDFDVDGDGEISFEEFRRMDQKFGMVLFPAYRLQDAVQRATLGSKTWVSLASKLNLERKRYAERNQVKRKLTAWEKFVRGFQACFGLEPDTGYRPLTAEEALQVHDAGGDMSAVEFIKAAEHGSRKTPLQPLGAGNQQSYRSGGRRRVLPAPPQVHPTASGRPPSQQAPTVLAKSRSGGKSEFSLGSVRRKSPSSSGRYASDAVDDVTGVEDLEEKGAGVGKLGGGGPIGSSSRSIASTTAVGGSGVAAQSANFGRVPPSRDASMRRLKAKGSESPVIASRSKVKSRKDGGGGFNEMMAANAAAIHRKPKSRGARSPRRSRGSNPRSPISAHRAVPV